MSLALWDWRRRVAALYAAVRAEADPAVAWRGWRAGRDALLRAHEQTSLEPEAVADFTGLPFFPYDPALRFVVDWVPTGPGPALVFQTGADGDTVMHGCAVTSGLQAALGGELTLYWIDGYGGGAFLPFADATSGQETYGAGRYLLDTIKGADLGSTVEGRGVLDFNFAYNPSCAYSPRWMCPLAPLENRLPGAVRAGEMTSEALSAATARL